MTEKASQYAPFIEITSTPSILETNRSPNM